MAMWSWAGGSQWCSHFRVCIDTNGSGWATAYGFIKLQALRHIMVDLQSHMAVDNVFYGMWQIMEFSLTRNILLVLETFSRLDDIESR